MKKLLALMLALATVLCCFAGCGKKDTLVVGITDFAPMDNKEDGEWVGFDADMAKAFAEATTTAPG